jgi:hypothetical protein
LAIKTPRQNSHLLITEHGRNASLRRCPSSQGKWPFAFEIELEQVDCWNHTIGSVAVVFLFFSASKNKLRTFDARATVEEKKFYMIIIAKQVHRVQRSPERLDLFFFLYFSHNVVELIENFLRLRLGRTLELFLPFLSSSIDLCPREHGMHKSPRLPPWRQLTSEASFSEMRRAAPFKPDSTFMPRWIIDLNPLSTQHTEANEQIQIHLKFELFFRVFLLFFASRSWGRSLTSMETSNRNAINDSRAESLENSVPTFGWRRFWHWAPERIVARSFFINETRDRKIVA